MPLWRRPDGPRQPIRQQATKAECPAFTHLFGMAYGRRRGRQRASLPSSILRFWRAWPIPPCANASSNWANSLGRPRNRRRKLSLRSKEPRSKNGGLSSRRRESEPSRRNLTRIAVEPSQRLNEILIKKRPPFGGLFVWSIQQPAALLRSWRSLLGPSAIVPDMRAIHPGQRFSFANEDSALQRLVRDIECQNVMVNFDLISNVPVHGTIPY